MEDAWLCAAQYAQNGETPKPGKAHDQLPALPLPALQARGRGDGHAAAHLPALRGHDHAKATSKEVTP